MACARSSAAPRMRPWFDGDAPGSCGPPEEVRPACLRVGWSGGDHRNLQEVFQGMDSRAMVECGRREALGAQHVEVAVAHLGQVGEDGVEVVVDRQVPAGQAVAVAGGEPHDQVDRPLGVGAAARSARCDVQRRTCAS